MATLFPDNPKAILAMQAMRNGYTVQLVPPNLQQSKTALMPTCDHQKPKFSKTHFVEITEANTIFEPGEATKDTTINVNVSTQLYGGETIMMMIQGNGSTASLGKLLKGNDLKTEQGKLHTAYFVFVKDEFVQAGAWSSI